MSVAPGGRQPDHRLPPSTIAPPAKAVSPVHRTRPPKELTRQGLSPSQLGGDPCGADLSKTELAALLMTAQGQHRPPLENGGGIPFMATMRGVAKAIGYKLVIVFVRTAYRLKRRSTQTMG
jgi:hypothetical protein